MFASRQAAAVAAALHGFAMTAIVNAAEAPLLAISSLPAPIPPPSLSSPISVRTDLLAVRINGVEQDGEVFVHHLADGGIAVAVSALRGWRFSVPADTLVIDGTRSVRLDRVAGLRWRIDARTQVLQLEVGASAFRMSGVEVAGVAPAAAFPPIAAGFLNYDVHLQRDTPRAGVASTLAAALLDFGASTAAGAGHTSVITRNSAGLPHTTRLDSTWVMDQPSALTSVQFGDTTGATGQWGRAVRFGGVRWSTDFSTRPGFVSFPLPALKGEASVPSVVDLYVNNQHRLQGNLPPGAFDLPDVPVVTGQGQIRMVVRDLLGREQVVVQPYYVTPQLLRPGLRDFSLEAGAIRDNYGIDSFRYGRVLLVGTDRVGVTETFTRELRAELLERQQTAGVGGVWLLGGAATAQLAAAASRREEGGWGQLVSAAVEHQSAGWSGSISGRLASSQFAQVGQTFDARVAPPRLAMGAHAATSIGSGGVAVNAIVQSDWQDGRYRALSFNYGQRLGPLGYFSVYASVTSGTTRGYAVGAFLTQTFGRDLSVTESAFRSRDRAADGTTPTQRSTQETIQLQAPPPSGPGFGYRVLGERAGQTRVAAEGFAQGDGFAASAGLARIRTDTSARIGAAGAIALLGDGVYFARRIDGSFAVVEVGDYADVRVTRDNQVVTRTDERGRAFVAGLRGYESNRIGVEPGDLPLDVVIDADAVLVAPPARGGVAVRMPVTRGRSAVLRVVDSAGRPVPPGSRARADNGSRDFPVGFDGKLFLSGMGERGEYWITSPEGRCFISIEWRPDPNDLPDLGDVTCH